MKWKVHDRGNFILEWNFSILSLMPSEHNKSHSSSDDDVTTMGMTRAMASWKNTNWRCKCQQVVRSKTHNTHRIFVFSRSILNQIRNNMKMLIDRTCDMKWNEIFIISSFLFFVVYSADVVSQHIPVAVKRSDIDIFTWQQIHAENSQLSHERFRKLQVCAKFFDFLFFLSLFLIFAKFTESSIFFFVYWAILIVAKYWLWWRQWRDCANDFLCMLSSEKRNKEVRKKMLEIELIVVATFKINYLIPHN